MATISNFETTWSLSCRATADLFPGARPRLGLTLVKELQKGAKMFHGFRLRRLILLMAESTVLVLIILGAACAPEPYDGTKHAPHMTVARGAGVGAQE